MHNLDDTTLNDLNIEIEAEKEIKEGDVDIFLQAFSYDGILDHFKHPHRPWVTESSQKESARIFIKNLRYAIGNNNQELVGKLVCQMVRDVYVKDKIRELEDRGWM